MSNSEAKRTMRIAVVLFALVSTLWLLDWLVVVPWTGADTCDSACTDAQDYVWIAWILLLWAMVVLALVVAAQFLWRTLRKRRRPL